MAFDPLNLTDLGADQIVTEATMLALYNNPIEIAQRGVGAPVVQVPKREYLVVPGPFSWTWPDGVTAARFILIGPGGIQAGATPPTNTTLVYGATTVTAGAGSSAPAGTQVAGGVATGGDLNLPGQNVRSGNPEGGHSPLGYGYGADFGRNATGYGAGGKLVLIGTTYTGSGGAYAEKRLEKDPGIPAVTLQVGSAGAPIGGAPTVYSNTGGLIIIEY